MKKFVLPIIMLILGILFAILNPVIGAVLIVVAIASLFFMIKGA